jgi:hypothetical protein
MAFGRKELLFWCTVTTQAAEEVADVFVNCIENALSPNTT